MKTMDERKSESPEAARKTDILLCAATHWEAAPVARRLKLRRNDEGIYEGIHAGRTVDLIATGIGRDRLLEGLARYETAAGGARAACCFSIGFAGSLSENARPGDIVADLHGADAEWVSAARESAQALGLRLHFGRVALAEKVLDAGEKAGMGRALRACAVDMESGVLRDWASRNKTQAWALRVIYDGLEESLPADLPAGGDWSETCLWALRRPGRWPGLARLGLRSRRCSGRLALFLESFLSRL